MDRVEGNELPDGAAEFGIQINLATDVVVRHKVGAGFDDAGNHPREGGEL